MNNVILPFLMSMLLGGTIDLRSYDISGVNVYDDDAYDETNATSLNTTYNVIQENVFPYAFFGIPADIVLRIKSNFLSSASGPMGLDGVLKDTSWKYNSAIVGVTTLYRTVDRSIKKDAVPLDNWKEKVPETQTHYVKSLFYGGWSVVLFRFKCDVASDVPLVRKVLTRNLGVIGHLNADTLPKWNQAIKDIQKDDDIRGTVTLHTHVYSTMPIQKSIENPEDLFEIISELPKLVGKLGQPLYMDLRPLNDLDKKYPIVKMNTELLNEWENLDEMMDDVKVTKVSMMRWVTETDTVFDDNQEDKISNLLTNINNCLKAFSKLGAEYSLFKPTDKRNLKAAQKTYTSGLEKGIETYNQVYRRLKEEVDARCENAFLHKIKGLLRVYSDEFEKKGEVKGGFGECQRLCIRHPKCRAIGYAEHISELDLATGLYLKREKQCWIYYRSTSTATLFTPNGLSGDMGVYDRSCY
ncbi:uncharacterized protein [Parasteatoda tepidariorum]|uniref:uncharacterized protein isoform X1 n=1 Tax=Parasteatoda tepidariorum TaxID=114398 RepID=UPI00077FE3B9|nr:uncharacterized protein LOC107442577 [Parasteatoda tepidariorum]